MTAAKKAVATNATPKAHRSRGLTGGQVADRLRERMPEAMERVEARRERRGPLGDAVFLRRMAVGLTQVELAEVAGVRPADISAIENGSGNQTRETLRKVGDALGLSLTYIPASEHS